MMAVIMGIILAILVAAIIVGAEHRAGKKRLAEYIADPYKEFPYMKEGIRMAAEQQSRIWKKQSKKGERLRGAKRKALRRR